MVETFIAGKLEAAVYHPSKMEQQSEIGKLKTALNLHLKRNVRGSGKKVNWKAADFLFEDAINQLVHKNVLENDRRPDGRKLDELRAFDAEVGFFRERMVRRFSAAATRRLWP